MTITAAADGSALGNPGPAGWAWYVDDGCWAAGGWPHATNNRGELQAVLELFLATAHLDDDLLVLCDSQYVINSVTKWMRGWKAKGWRKGDGKPVLNVDLLQQLDAALVGRRYRFEWVKGHANHPLNEAADARARGAAEAYQRKTAVPAGPGWHRAGDPPALPRATAAGTGVAAGTTATARPPAVTGSAEAPAATTGARAGGISPSASKRMPEHPGLFDLDDPDASPDRILTVALSPSDYADLERRAELAGTSPDEFVRRLVRSGAR